MNISVENVKCECCSCVIDENVQFQYIFCEGESKSDIQKLIFNCIGKNVTFTSDFQQLICVPCLQQLRQIEEFKHKCAENEGNGFVNQSTLVFSIETLPSTSIINTLDECEDYEVLENVLEQESNLSPLKYLEQIQFESIKDVFEDVEFESVVPCSICNHPLKSHTNLIQHIIEYHVDFESAESLYYPCNVDNECNRFKSIKQANRHILEAHYSTKLNLDDVFNLKCLICNLKFLSKIDFGKHACIESNSVDLAGWICNVCNAKFTSQHKLNFHFQFHLVNARPKICLICLIHFNTERDFYNHVMYFHDSSTSHANTHCDEALLSNQLLKEHETIHDKPNNHTCAICNDSFSSEELLNQHALCHMINKLYKCPVCGKQLNRASRLRKHIASHDQPKFGTIFSCDLCDLSYSAEDRVIEHIKTIHNIIEGDEVSQLCSKTSIDHVFCCEYCAKLYRTSKCLKEHRKLHEGIDQPYECQYCTATYDSFSKMRTHQIAHGEHKTDRNQFPVHKFFLCRYNCDKSYRHWSDLSHHMNMVHLSKPVTCEICHKTFPFKWNYQYHKKTNHSRKRIFRCNMNEDCLEEFQRTKDYNNHKKEKHAKVKSIKTCRKCKYVISSNESHECFIEEVTNCELCGKMFSTVKALKIHIKVVHDRIINYRCEYCNRGFYNSSDKNIHLRIHTQEKPFHCTICSYECRSQSTLSEHMRTHTNQRPFICPYPKCGANFRRSYAMKTHFKIHSGERNFKCTFADCSKTFRSQSQLNYHFKKKHMNADVVQIETITENIFEDLDGMETIANNVGDDLSIEN